MNRQEKQAFVNQNRLELLQKLQKKLIIRVPKGNIVYRYEFKTGDVVVEPSFTKGDRHFKITERKLYMYVDAVTQESALRKFMNFINKANGTTPT